MCVYMPVDRGCLHKLISQIDTCFYMPVDRGCLHKLISQIDTDWDILWPKIDKRMMKLSLLTQMKFYCIFALSFCTSLYWSIPVLHVFYLLECFTTCEPVWIFKTASLIIIYTYTCKLWWTQWQSVKMLQNQVLKSYVFTLVTRILQKQLQPGVTVWLLSND